MVSKRKFSPSGNGCALPDVVVVNDVSLPLGLVADVVLTFDIICVPSNSSDDIALCINSNRKFSLANTAVPPTSATPDSPDTDGVDETVITYESIPMFDIDVCVLFISVSGTEFI